MTLPLHALQQAVLAALKVDSAVAALTNNIYTRIPNKASAPYIALGDTRCTDQSNIAQPQFECELSLNVFSRARGGREATEILDAIHDVLERNALNVSGYRLLHSRFVNARSTRSASGQSVQGRISFRFTLQAT